MDIDYYKKYEPIFNFWTIKKQLGEGVFGKVFEIEREEQGKTYQAVLKVITVPQEDIAVGFVRELKVVMDRLKENANVARYKEYAIYKHDDGIGCDILIRMELLTPLYEHIKCNRVTPNMVIKLGIDICKALELCSKYNIIHRDIKPENIFVTANGEFKLADFGITQVAEKTFGEAFRKKNYSYMAPEVYRGEEYGTSVDIYSLGIVLYCLLNGNRAPFISQDSKTITNQDREKAIMSRLAGTAIPVLQEVDGRLSEIVLKACAYKPQQRYLSPMQMRQDLEAIVHDEKNVTNIKPIESDGTMPVKVEWKDKKPKEPILVERDLNDNPLEEGIEGKKRTKTGKKGLLIKCGVGILVAICILIAGKLLLFQEQRYSAADCVKVDDLQYQYENGGVVITDISSTSQGKLLEIPEKVGEYKVISIKDHAVRFSKYLEKITIPESVESIGKSAFYSCDQLKKIELPNSITAIPEECFSYCKQLEKIELPKNVTTIGEKAFYSCDSLKEIELPSGTKTIGAQVFADCKSLVTVKLGKSIKEIPERAFESCKSLEKIEIPDGVTSIGKDAFWMCDSLKTIRIPESVTSIDKNVFEYGADKHISSIIVKKGSFAEQWCLDQGAVELIHYE